MPLTDKPSRLYPHRVHREARSGLHPAAKHRQEFADSLISPKGGHPTIKPRYALLRYARQIGLLKRYQHLDDEAQAKLADYFGTRYTMLTLVTPPILREELIHRTYEAEEPGERPPVKFEPTPDILPDGFTPAYGGTDMPTGAEARLALRSEQRSNRVAFAHWLRSKRKGPCSPQRAFRTWYQTPAYSRLKSEAPDILGIEAGRWLAKLPTTDREELATKLEELFP